MSDAQNKRGGAPVGFLTELNGLEAASVIYLRLWCDGLNARAKVKLDLATTLGPELGRKALQAFEGLCGLCSRHCRRPLLRHSVECECLGADESCFANFVAAAAAGGREDAMLIATLLVRPDIAPMITASAAELGHALMRMNLSTPNDMHGVRPSNHTNPTTLH